MKQILTSNNIEIMLLLILVIRGVLYPIYNRVYQTIKKKVQQRRDIKRKKKIKFLLTNFKLLRSRLNLKSNKSSIKEVSDGLQRKSNAVIRTASTKIGMNKLSKKVILHYTIHIEISIDGKNIRFCNYYEAGEWNRKENTFKGKYRDSQIYKDFFYHVLMSIANDKDINNKDEILLHLLYNRKGQYDNWVSISYRVSESNRCY